MKPIRLKVTWITFLGAGLIVFLGTFSLYNLLSLSHQNQRMRQSYMLRDWVANLPAQSIKEATIKDLQSYREDINPLERQDALSDIIQAYSSDNRTLLRKRVQTFDYLERKFVAQIEPAITYLERKTIYFSSIFLFALIVGIFWLRQVVIRKTLDPIERTTTQMIDFLNGQYSYHFEVPSPDEIGDLQSSFNSMAQRVLQNMEELKTLDMAKSEFLNIASHELRTPMTSIKGSLGLLTSGVMGDVPKEALNLIEIAEVETDRLIRFTNEILDMAKIESGRMPLKEAWIPLRQLISKTMEGLGGLAETTKVHMEIYPESVDVEVYADQDRIQQVLTNLLSNALKFSPKESLVSVGALIEEIDLKIFVSDQGRGISPDDQKRIFEKFRQATGPENPLVKGTGLGLAIARAIVEQHNGQIGVHSVPNQGSTFFFTLPRWRQTEEFEERIAA